MILVVLRVGFLVISPWNEAHLFCYNHCTMLAFIRGTIRFLTFNKDYNREFGPQQQYFFVNLLNISSKSNLNYTSEQSPMIISMKIHVLLNS